MYVCVFFVWISEQTVIISLYGIGFYAETECAVRTESSINFSNVWFVWHGVPWIATRWQETELGERSSIDDH
jgi:hypothetical protein